MNRFRSTLTGLLVAAFVALIHIAPAHAQTSLNSTTLSSALTSKSTQVLSLTSAASINVNDLLVVDDEVDQVQSCSTASNTCVVTRGRNGTRTWFHAANSVVWTGPPKAFYKDYVVGTCTSTSETYLPHIVLPDGDAPDVGVGVFDCLNSEWVLEARKGARDAWSGRTDGGTTYATAGAVVIQPGVQFIGSAGALAMTLAAPTRQQNGSLLVFSDATGHAHTLTTPASTINGASHIATFNGTAGSSVTVVAANGVWWVVALNGVSIS